MSLLHTSNAFLLLLFLWFAQVINLSLNINGWRPPRTKISHTLPPPLKFLHQFLCNLYSYCHTELSFLNKFQKFPCPQIIRIGSHIIVLLWYFLPIEQSFKFNLLLILYGVFNTFYTKKTKIKSTMLRMNQYTHAHFAKYCLFICGMGCSVSIVTDYGLDSLGLNAVYNKQAGRKVVGACCSVYIAKCSESNSWVHGVFTKCGVVFKQGKFCKIDHGRTTTYNGMYFWP